LNAAFSSKGIFTCVDNTHWSKDYYPRLLHLQPKFSGFGLPNFTQKTHWVSFGYYPLKSPLKNPVKNPFNKPTKHHGTEMGN
jgi:hypothetical protein